MDLPHRAVAVYTYLHDRANKDGECWPSVKTKAGDIKLSPATVRRAIKDLKKAGLIKTEQRYRERVVKAHCCLDLNSVQTLFKLGYGKFPEYMI